MSDVFLEMGPQGQLYHVGLVFVAILGACIGSFLNVVIWRVPRGESIVTAPSHCPKCGHGIRWYENLPVLSWLALRGKCSACRAPINARYPTVEAMTAVLFLAVWVRGWQRVPPQPLAMIVAGLVLAALLIAITYIDLDHMIIPDGLTLFGGVVIVMMTLLWPTTHDFGGPLTRLGEAGHRGLTFLFGAEVVRIILWPGLLQSPRALAMLDLVMGAILGGGILWAIVEVGKLLFGRRRMRRAEPLAMRLLPNGFLTEDEEAIVEWEELFVRKRDKLTVRGILQSAKLKGEPPPALAASLDRREPGEYKIDERGLHLGETTLPLGDIEELIIQTREWTEPREVMGFGDVKLLAMIGAFLGPGAALMILAISSFLGSVGGVLLILCNRLKLYSQMPYGPYIALATIVYMLVGGDLLVAAYAAFMRSVGLLG